MRGEVLFLFVAFALFICVWYKYRDDLRFCQVFLATMLGRRFQADREGRPYNLPVLAKLSHQIQDIVDVVPVEDAAMNDGPTAFVVGTDDLCQVAVEVVPQP